METQAICGSQDSDWVAGMQTLNVIGKSIDNFYAMCLFFHRLLVNILSLSNKMRLLQKLRLFSLEVNL